MARVHGALARADFVAERDIVKDLEPISGSEDAHLLVGPVEGVEVAYLYIGSAEPGLVAQARLEGKEFPFFNHNPDYQVDLNVIPYGGKIAALVALDLLSL